MNTTEQNYNSLNNYKTFRTVCKEIATSRMRCDPNIIKIIKISDLNLNKLSSIEIVKKIKNYIYDHLEYVVDYDDIDYVCHVMDLVQISYSNNIKVSPIDIYQAINPSYYNAGILGLIKAIQPIKNREDIKDKIIAISVIKEITDRPEIRKTFMAAIEKFVEND